jgi:hypothetical protein
MNYAPHTLIAKDDFASLPKGSLLTYITDEDDTITYRVGSRACKLRLEDATNGEYFAMTEAAMTEAEAEIETEAAPAAPDAHAKIADTIKSLLFDLMDQNLGVTITTGIIAIMVVFLDITGVFGPDHPTGISLLGIPITAAYWLGIAVVIRRFSGQLSKWATAGVIIGMLLLHVYIAIRLGETRPMLNMFDLLGFWAAIRMMRLKN